MFPTSTAIPSLKKFNRFKLLESALSKVVTCVNGPIVLTLCLGTIVEGCDEDDTTTFHTFSAGQR
jgi:hypothetical protein